MSFVFYKKKICQGAFLKKRKKQIENWASTKKLNSPGLA
jgi:hypothetical protein